MSDPIEAVVHLGSWSAWVPFDIAVLHAPLSPGVYIAREASAGPIVCVGMAGYRRGKGIRGRLAIYRSGKAALSGLGEAAMDRALADTEWVHERLSLINAGQVERTTLRAQSRSRSPNLHICWAARRRPKRPCTTDLAGALRDRIPGRYVATGVHRLSGDLRGYVVDHLGDPGWDTQGLQGGRRC